MKFYCISDNIDTQIGMRLAGIEGIVVHEPDEVKNALETACADGNIGVILVSDKLVKLSPELIYDLKLNRKRPLIVEIPDRHGDAQISDAITRYVRESIGVKI